MIVRVYIPQNVEGSIFSAASPALLLFDFLMIIIPSGVRWDLSVVLFCISPVASGAEHFSCIYLPSEKCLLFQLSIFGFGFSFWGFNFLSSLSILDISHLPWSVLKMRRVEPDMVAHTYNPSALKAGAGLFWVQGQPEFHSEMRPCLQKSNKYKRRRVNLLLSLLHFILGVWVAINCGLFSRLCNIELGL